jgi:putative addiction module component (TIGR02574 family)
MTEIKKILQLSVDERIHLVQTIWDSIADETETSPISEEHKIILDERLKAHKDNPNDLVGWDEVKKAAKRVL